jgi:glycosyltransferase involved in cell wall biosynthesis
MDSTVMKLALINDNTPDQVNGVVRTMSTVKNELENRGFAVFDINPTQFLHSKGWLYPDLSLTWCPCKVGKILQNIDPDHIHIVTEGPLGLAAKLACDRLNWKYTTSFHTRWDMFVNSMVGFHVPGIKKYLSWFHKRSQAVLATTPSMQQALAAMEIPNAVVWSRGVDHAQFRPGAGSGQSKPTLLNVGRVSAEKNLDQFLQLDPQKYHLKLVGDGPCLKQFKQQYPHVEFTGMLYGNDLAKAYAQADVFVFPSTSDTFGLVMLESMACGTPVAAFPVPGPVDVIKNGENGFVEHDLDHAIGECLNLDRQIVVNSSQKWSWSSVADRFIANLVKKT